MLGRIRYHWTCLTRPGRAPITLQAAYREPLARLLAYLSPVRADGVPKRRYGSRHDGGYVMLDDFAGITGAYSLGIGGNVRWDLAMADKGLPIWQYDHTVEGPPHSHARFVFNKVRIGTKADAAGAVTTLPALIEKRAVAAGELILKIDIEGDEWEVFEQIDPGQLKVFRQILVEFHHFPRITDPAWRDRAMTAMEHLTRHHSVIHVHGNNFGAMVTAQDIRFPDGLEVSFALKDAYRLVPTEETFPGAYDRPNNPFRPDPPLGTFRFET